MTREEKIAIAKGAKRVVDVVRAVAETQAGKRMRDAIVTEVRKKLRASPKDLELGGEVIGAILGALRD